MGSEWDRMVEIEHEGEIYRVPAADDRTPRKRLEDQCRGAATLTADQRAWSVLAHVRQSTPAIATEADVMAWAYNDASGATYWADWLSLPLSTTDFGRLLATHNGRPAEQIQEALRSAPAEVFQGDKVLPSAASAWLLGTRLRDLLPTSLRLLIQPGTADSGSVVPEGEFRTWVESLVRGGQAPPTEAAAILWAKERSKGRAWARDQLKELPAEHRLKPGESARTWIERRRASRP